MKTPIDLYKLGEYLHFNDARETTNGKRSEGILTVAAGKSGPPAHRHLLQDEGFEIVSGEMIVEVESKQIILKAGQRIVVKPGESHTFKNGSTTEKLVANFWFEPALNMEWMLQTFGEEAMKRGGSWANVPILQMLYCMHKMRKEYRIAGMPFWLQDVLLGFFAWLAEITGEAKKINLPDSLK